ncbi:MAG: lysine-2,3-aminomutase-like protein [Steroidobacteraceae bacterium]
MADAGGKTLKAIRELKDAGFFRETELATIEEVARSFAVSISPEMLALIDIEGASGPIATQFVPSPLELLFAPEELADPIGDKAHSPVPGIVHRYPDRVLFKPANVCAVYCRFCFRRETVANSAESLDDAAIERALNYIESTPSIWEVVVSGGDPLILSARRLKVIMRCLEDIKHIGVVRFHTRIPVVRPELIDLGLIDALKIDKAVYLILHTNHVRELTEEARRACAKLINSGFPMLSQTVLLKGVNADAQTLTSLFRALVEMRIKPYYLHHGDLAKGTKHFRTSIEQGQELMRTLRGTVSGLCQPLYVLDIPGGHGKVPIGPNYLSRSPEGSFEVCDVRGSMHTYCDSVAPTI